ncbi:MAG: hypothetical protein J5I93_29100, partial [Pirellulaceae bacterium]|nr:hypothetical protein [Pirellulaceae bacterium]
MRSRPATTLLPCRLRCFAFACGLARCLACCLACWLGPSPPAHGQGTSEDYERAERLEQLTRNKVFREQVQPNWLPGNSRFWYQVSTGPQQHEFVLVDAERGMRQLAFDHERLAAALAQASGRPARGDRLPLSRLEPAADGGKLRFDAWGRRWEVSLASYELQPLDKPVESAAAPGSANLPTLTAFDSPRPSGNGGDETWVQFANQSDRPVRLFWIDAQGERKQYATLGPKEQHRQHTYAGHVWLVLSEDGTRGTYFEAAAAEATATIDAGALKRL